MTDITLAAPAGSSCIMKKGRQTGATELERLLAHGSAGISLNSLARAASSSGKRLVLEIRDQHPVQIIRAEARA